MSVQGVCKYCGETYELYPTPSKATLDPTEEEYRLKPHLCAKTLASLTAERDALKAENERVKAESTKNGMRGVVCGFIAGAECKRDFEAENSELRIALRETREALADTLDLATKVAICEMEAMASKEPGSDVFGCAGIAEKAKVARARAAWKAFDDCVKPVLARHAGLVEEVGRG